jgi:hypothetical protein
MQYHPVIPTVIEISNDFSTVNISEFSEILAYIITVVLVLIDININLYNNI